MKRITQYVTVLEAIGMLGSRSAIHNRLNRVHAATDDAELRPMLSTLIDQFSGTGTNTSHTSIEHMNACKVAAEKIRKYCERQRDQLYPAGS